MQEVLLWFDNNPRRKLADKVIQAADRYRITFSQRPTTCYLNVADLNGCKDGDEVRGLRLQAVPNVLRHHLWIGVENGNSNDK